MRLARNSANLRASDFESPGDRVYEASVSTLTLTVSSAPAALAAKVIMNIPTAITAPVVSTAKPFLRLGDGKASDLIFIFSLYEGPEKGFSRNRRLFFTFHRP
jgi:hypothetical protein